MRKNRFKIPKLSDIAIRYRLAISYSILIFFTSVISIVSILRINKAHDNIEFLANKEFIVIDTERKLKEELLHSHNIITDVVLGIDSIRKKNVIKEIKKSENIIDSLTNLLSIRYNGNITEIFKIEKNLLILNENRHKIVLYLSKNEIDSARSLLNYKENYQLDFLLAKIQQIILTSLQHSTDIYKSTLAEKKRVTNLLILLCIVVVIFGITLSVIITQSITNPLRNIIRSMENIANEQFDNKLNIYRNDEMGKLADAFRDMQSNILRWAADIKADDAYENWIKTGQAHLYKQIRGDISVYELGAVIITFLTKYIDAQSGVIYFVYEKAKHLKLIGSYAIKSRTDAPDYIKFGDGLVGQVVLEQQTKHLKNLDEKYFVNQTSITEIYPKELIIMPLTYSEKVIAVVEIGSYKTIGKRETEFLESVKETLAIVLNTASMKVRKSRHKRAKTHE